MNVELMYLPCDARPERLAGRACAVFDVLRATTTITAALAAGVEEIHLFDSLDAARAAAAAHRGPRLLCGESQCVAPAGFDLGNSPGQFTDDHRGATLFMCTSNGTRALLSARGAELVLAAALVNAAAVARVLHDRGLDLTLVCAGTNGEMAEEDLLGAGAVIDELARLEAGLELSIEATDALNRYYDADSPLDALRRSAGGRNVIKAGLEADIEFAARLNVFDIVGVASGDPLVVRQYPSC
jgi:2-phosphosulfolactate phosphatase